MKSLNKWLSLFIKWVTAGFLAQTGAGEESSCCCLEESTFCGRAVLNKHLVLGRGDVEPAEVMWRDNDLPPREHTAHSHERTSGILRGKVFGGSFLPYKVKGNRKKTFYCTDRCDVPEGEWDANVLGWLKSGFTMEIYLFFSIFS